MRFGGQRRCIESSDDNDSIDSMSIQQKNKEKEEWKWAQSLASRAAEMASGNSEEGKGMLLRNGDDRIRLPSPQRGTPDTSSTQGHPYTDQIVTINVSGMRFQTFESTLSRYPNSLLGDRNKRQHFFVSDTNEFFFDRHRTTFESILYIYQSGGRVKRPEIVPIDIFLKEMRFFQMGDDLLEEFWIAEGYEKPKEVMMPNNKTQRKIWELMEYPDSSLSARIIAFISIAVIALSIISFCWETVPSDIEEKPINNSATAELLDEMDEKHYSPFFWIELMCILWFTIELILRFISCPCKVTFATSVLNIIDFVAIAPFFVNFFFADTSKSNSSMSFAVLRVLRLVRVFRVFKLSRHSVGLQILGKTFRSSVQEFCLLIFFMAIALVLFASGMYFAEQGEPNSKFTSIPASFWFVLVTMTTVGYGDLVPLSPFGKVVGGMCAMIGVLTLALPVPIIVANFKHFYRQENRLASMKSKGDDADDDIA
ncbi:Potassium voltage-gated channel protein shk-1 [Caenorhabditis elegans]|uniref:Isoform a of Potassium voltage-gated channel protein shk-1 n=1 Tax=Caenorhabditis elegans TaxID=6239 RepID=Q8I4B0-4|nr:Potassium voltage-gated channel protein shk-1 [Caenorhabditis elegans]CAA88477.2 Potassium voltage-gated channel protein shk-1 [Caenorhabditis elegans]|eukprot:NP_496104.2 Potassium voltage-gated channel protein shk-1 [Caenorhabditis elegans]